MPIRSRMPLAVPAEMQSVIITCYNLERFIGEAIHSVLDQQFVDGAQIVVVDDCSTDGSAAIIQSFPSVQYIRTAANSGVLLAMLEGIRRTDGEYIHFLDGDDIWEPGKLSALAEAFDADTELAWLTHDLSFIDGAGRPISRRSRPDEVLGPVDVEQRSAKLTDGILRHQDFIWLGSALAIRRSKSDLEAFDRWARTLPDPANCYQDWPLAYWLASLPGTKAGYIPRKLFRYRLHGANHSGGRGGAARSARNFRRAGNTVEAMLEIARMRGLDQQVQAGLERRSQAYHYLAELYSGHRLQAAAGLVRAAPEFARRSELSKELIRFAAIQAIGPARFSDWAARRAGGG